MANRKLLTAAALCITLQTLPAYAESSAYVDPYVSVSKGARIQPKVSAAVPVPSPDRFGPVYLVPDQDASEQSELSKIIPSPQVSKPPAEAGCTITSAIAGDEAKALIAQIAAEEDFDLTLLNAIAKQESDFRMNQRSSAGALGLMQLMPSTARSLGVDPCDPEQNVRGAIKLLRLLDEKYQGNTIYILAAYNAGEDAVDRNGGIPPYRETITYVTRILSNLNGWTLPRASKAKPSEPSVSNANSDQSKPAGNRWAQGFVLHVE